MQTVTNMYPLPSFPRTSVGVHKSRHPMPFLSCNSSPLILRPTVLTSYDWALPVELITLIFRYAVSNEPDRKVNRILSHTCRLWREIALASPLLWKTVEFTSSYDPEYRWPQLCITRSKKCVIDIIITRQALQFDVEDVEEQRITIQRAATIISSLLIPEASRWGKVDINLPNPHLYNLLHKYLTRVSEASKTVTAAQLTSLTVACDQRNQLNVPKLVFPSGFGRKLTRLVLNTLNVDWKQWDLVNLTYLELVRHERETVRPRPSELYDMLSRTPLLEELHLNGSGPCATGHEATSVKRFVTLEKLHTLTIGCQSSTNDVVALLHILRAPHLDKLIMSEWRGDEYDRAITLLGSPDSGAGTGFPSITYIHIRGIDMSDGTFGMEAFGEFLRSITNVRHIFSELHGMNPLSLLPLTDPAPQLRYPVPKLECFQVTGPHRGCVTRMIEARHAIGRPLKKLIVGRMDTKITKELNARLESMVETVMYIDPVDGEDNTGCEGSDYGEEEDDDDDDDEDEDEDEREYDEEEVCE